jgi:NAD(P)-dependent dehydrogenase (short-subunit alcohol dehydrogenase family)
MSKSVLVIGANGGVGSCLVGRLIEGGYDVVASVSSLDKAESLKRRLPACRAVLALNLANANHVQDALEQLIGELEQPLDAVIVCAAVSPVIPAETTSLEVFRRAHEINCVSPLAIYRTVIPSLRRTRGRLILISSLSGKVGMPLQAAYVSSKFALEGLADVLRQESSGWGVHVVVVQPGGIDTPMVDRAIESARECLASLREPNSALYAKLLVRFEALASEAKRQNRLTSPQEVAEVAMNALESFAPEARYAVGTDAQMFIGAAKKLSDREIDNLVLGAYRSS